MKRLLILSRSLLAAAALSLLAGTAFAQAGLNLSWNDCGAAGALQKNFACTTNTGIAVMFASVVTGVDMGQLNGMAGVIDMQTNEAALSDWWKFNSGGCRNNSPSYLSGNFDFTSVFSCIDPWLGGAAGGIDYTQAFNGLPNRARVRSICAIVGSTAINSTDEYYWFKIQFGYQRTTGTGSCAGCADGACFVFNSLLVTQPLGVGDFVITSPLATRHVLWQAGGSAISGAGCPNEVPVRNHTWGAVKSLYR